MALRKHRGELVLMIMGEHVRMRNVIFRLFGGSG